MLAQLGAGVKLPVYYGGVAGGSQGVRWACLGLQGFAERPLKTPPERGLKLPLFRRSARWLRPLVRLAPEVATKDTY